MSKENETQLNEEFEVMKSRAEELINREGGALVEYV